MKRNLVTCALAAFAAGAIAQIPNGGFETNTVGGGFGDTADGWSNPVGLYPSSSPDTWDNGGVNGSAPGTSSYMTNVTAYEGKKWAAVATDAGLGGFEEAIESSTISLAAGQYTVSAALLADGLNTFNRHGLAEINVYLRDSGGGVHFGGTLAANTGNQQWELRSTLVTVGTADNYSVIFANESIENSYIGIDATNIAAVPEPATVATLSLGALTLLRRRRR